jgi:hypothetical protein
MSLEIIYADIHTLYHVQEVGLKDKGLSRMIEHACRVFQFLEILEPSSDFFS